MDPVGAEETFRSAILLQLAKGSRATLINPSYKEYLFTTPIDQLVRDAMAPIQDPILQSMWIQMIKNGLKRLHPNHSGRIFRAWEGKYSFQRNTVQQVTNCGGVYLISCEDEVSFVPFPFATRLFVFSSLTLLFLILPQDDYDDDEDNLCDSMTEIRGFVDAALVSFL